MWLKGSLKKNFNFTKKNCIKQDKVNATWLYSILKQLTLFKSKQKKEKKNRSIINPKHKHEITIIPSFNPFFFHQYLWQTL